MPSIGRIQSTNFQQLLDELGITRNNIPFDLRSEVSPVVLVGGTVSFIAAPTPAYGVTDIFTNGVVVDPNIGDLLADTGPLPAGAYSIQIFVSTTETNAIDFQWRNAGNSANLFSQRIQIEPTQGENVQLLVRILTANDDERFRLVTVRAAAVAEEYQGTIFAKI